MEETISLQEVFAVIKKRVVLIITMMFIFLGVSAIMTFIIMTPKYSSDTQMVVTLPQPADGVSSNVNDVNFNLYMITTYKDFIKKSNVVAEMTHDILVKENNYKGTPEQIQGMIEVTQEQNSQMFAIKATTDDAYIAQAAANTVAKVFQEQAKEFLQVDKVSIIAPANLNVKPVSPNNKLNLMIGIVLGLMVGTGISFLIELLDKTVKDDKFIKEDLVFAVLGTVPEMTAKELNAKIVPQNIPSHAPKSEQEIGNQTRRARSRV